MRVSRPLCMLAAVVIALTAGVPTVAADGPWRGVVFDAETQHPLPGVVVVVVFYRLEGGWWGHSAWYYHDSSEALTDAAGRFEIPPRSFWSMIGKELRFTYFKLGYGRWRYRGQGTPAWMALPEPERSKRATAMREAVTSSKGSEIELHVAKTREDQLRHLSEVPHDAPESHMPLLRKARQEALEALSKTRQ